ncbi:uncharacterized protein A4U43_C04F21340 [Asparagus officinalis]|uniref:Uncharacterized protein n=1 Tax=Asparagus officinalis TaxID=4686 RepID=A0A5P1F398_ASPOF|nr:uncharacterized protein A4U43_C04F21340 [Asparagus officinalis]
MRGFVYDLIPTPLTDGGSPTWALKSEPATREDKKNPEAGNLRMSRRLRSELTADWVAEHARQAPESSLKATSPSIISQVFILKLRKLALPEYGDSTAIREEHTPYKAGDGTNIDGDRGDGNSEENEAVGAVSEDTLEPDEIEDRERLVPPVHLSAAKREACDLRSAWNKMNECKVGCR